MHDWAADISLQVFTTTGRPFAVKVITPLGGGCINQAYCIADDNQRFFVKLNTSDTLPMFEAEAAGLMEIHRSHTLRVPSVLCHGKNEQYAWLVLEYLDIHSGVQGSATDFGTQLAAMHRVCARQFGWIRNNTLGHTPQINTVSSNWVQFWRTHRLGYQLDLAKTHGYTGRLQDSGEKLMIDLDKLLGNRSPVPSLLHGDLWNGNYSYDAMGRPVLFDPAVYYGDREADIAMTELFGGFPANFYSAYRNDYPLDSGYNIRKIVYNLYHILNHLNLFGSGYLNQAEQMIIRLLAEIR
ncbi:MAG: fructosamine kinase family protein [Pseudomonadota bacterium]